MCVCVSVHTHTHVYVCYPDSIKKRFAADIYGEICFTTRNTIITFVLTIPSIKAKLYL